jgi:hypothetical protein
MKSEKMDDIAQETARQTSLLDRARRKYKHSGIKLMDPTVELKSLLDEPAPTSPIQKKKVVIDYSKPRASANSAFKSPKPKPRPKLVVATDVTKNSAIKKTGPVIDTNFLMENFGATSRSLATAMGSVTAAATDFGSANDDFGYSEGKDESERKQESKTGGVDSSFSPIKTNSSAWAWDAKLRGISTTNPESVARFSKMAAASTNALNSLFIEDDDEVNADDKSKAKPQLEIEVEGKTQEDNAKEDDGYADEFNNYEDEFEFDAENPSHTPPVVISAVEKERQIKQEREQEEEEEKQRKIDSEREREDRRQARKRERDALRAVEEFRLTEVERLRKEEEAELKHRAIELEIQKEIERQKLNEIQRQDEERLEKIRLEERRNEREKEEEQTRELELEKKQREEKMKQQNEEQEKHEKIRERREKQTELELEQQKQDNERQAREKAVAAARDKAREIVGGANSPIKFIATSPIKATLSPASTPATLVMKTEPDEEGSDPYGFDDEWELDL